jgi:hypothetical protein
MRIEEGTAWRHSPASSPDGGSGVAVVVKIGDSGVAVEIIGVGVGVSRVGVSVGVGSCCWRE